MSGQDESNEIPQDDSSNALDFLEESRKLRQEEERSRRGITIKTILKLAEDIEGIE